MTRFKLFPKRKSSFNQHANNGNTTDNTSTLPVSTLPHYSSVNPNTTEYPLKTLSDKRVKVLSKHVLKRITLFLCHLFKSDHSDFLLLWQQLLLTNSPTNSFFTLKNLSSQFSSSNFVQKNKTPFSKIELLPRLEIIPVIETTMHRPNNLTIKVRVLAPPPQTQEKSPC